MTIKCVIPNPNDFLSAFGCECNIDQDLIQTCIFFDKKNNEARLTFGKIDQSFGLSVFYGGLETVRIYDEYLYSVNIQEKKQIIEVQLGTSDYLSMVSIEIWPEIKFSMIRMQ